MRLALPQNLNGLDQAAQRAPRASMLVVDRSKYDLIGGGLLSGALLPRALVGLTRQIQRFPAFSSQ